jgi:hypothetical protein
MDFFDNVMTAKLIISSCVKLKKFGSISLKFWNGHLLPSLAWLPWWMVCVGWLSA